MTSKWLDPALTRMAYRYKLCLTSEDFQAEMKRMRIKPESRPAFVLNAHSNATTHFFAIEASDGGLQHPVALVCLKDSHADPIVVAGLLVHEAVHIWQAHARRIGSFNDHGDEEEAYAIQWIAQQLMWSYKEQT